MSDADKFLPVCCGNCGGITWLMEFYKNQSGVAILVVQCVTCDHQSEMTVGDMPEGSVVPNPFKRNKPN